MRLINSTNLECAWIPGRLEFPGHSLTVVVKGTFELRPDAAVELVTEDADPLTGEIYESGQPGGGCRYGGDFAFYKPRADVSLVGTCYAPNQAPVEQCSVSLRVGELAKSLVIQGDTKWKSALLGAKPVGPEPFMSMPIGYANSYGGEGYAANPIGKGFAKLTDDQGKSTRWIPNVQDRGALIVSPSQREEPAGFGPLDPTWAERMCGVGTYKEKWQRERWPWFPEDYDWGMQNAAPRDQQIDTYLRGDESLVMENLHADLAEYQTQLPGLRVRVFLEGCLPEQGDEADRAQRREVDMVLDTLWVDMDAERLVLVWRGATPVLSQKYEELEKALVIVEPLEAQSPPSDSYYPLFEEEGEVIEIEDPALEEPEADVPYAEAVATAIEEAKAEVTVQLDTMRAKQPLAGAAIDKAKSVILAEDQALAIDAMIAEAGITESMMAQVKIDEQMKARELFEQQGLDTSVLDAPEESSKPELPEAPTRENLEAQAVAGEFADQDLPGLDLRDAQLAGANFQNSILDSGLFSGADLTGANFAGATLDAADFSGALLTGAVFTGADLSQAVFSDANLENAVFDDSIIDGANLSGANMKSVHAENAQFVDTNLSTTELQGACLDGADFAGANLDGANLDGASLVRASFGTASGDGVSMIEADLTELRAGDGCSFPNGQFSKVRGERSLWPEADLRGADFSDADLPSADFSRAQLESANLCRAELSFADLAEAKLCEAKLVQTNLFQARLKEADLTNADFTGSNCFQAEFWDAIVENTDFLDANLKMTKIANLAK